MKIKNHHWAWAAYGPEWSREYIRAGSLCPGDVVLGRETYGRSRRGMVKSVGFGKPRDGSGAGRVTVTYRGVKMGEGFLTGERVWVRTPRHRCGYVTDYGYGPPERPRRYYKDGTYKIV